MDKHIKLLAPKYFETKFIGVDAENCPFFVTKLAIKVLPCVLLFRDGVATDRIVGFHELGGVDDFSTSALETRLLKKGLIIAKKATDEDGEEKVARSVRSTVNDGSDSD
jgi:thioredoxin-like negative regulator of GroEL